MLKVSDALNLLTALRNIATEQLPAPVAYKFARNIQILTPVAEAFESKRADEIKAVVGEDNIKPDGTFTVDESNRDALNAKITEILNTEEPALDGLLKIKIDNLNDVSLPLVTVQALMPIIED